MQRVLIEGYEYALTVGDTAVNSGSHFSGNDNDNEGQVALYNPACLNEQCLVGEWVMGGGGALDGAEDGALVPFHPLLPNGASEDAAQPSSALPTWLQTNTARAGLSVVVALVVAVILRVGVLQRTSSAEEESVARKKRKRNRGKANRKRSEQDDEIQTAVEHESSTGASSNSTGVALQKSETALKMEASTGALPNADEVHASTGGKIRFAPRRVLGQGSHGTIVYEGSFEGRSVAVKRVLSQFYDIASHEVS